MTKFRWLRALPNIDYSFFGNRRWAARRFRNSSMAPVSAEVLEVRTLLSATTESVAFDAYLADVEVADQAYIDSTDTAEDVYNGSIVAANTVFEGAVRTAVAAYDSAVDAANTTYNSDMDATENAYTTNMDAATVTYDGAVAAAGAAYNQRWIRPMRLTTTPLTPPARHTTAT